MDATGLWFSKLESNFYADYGQFRWTEEQRTWDWDNLTTVDLVSTKDGTKRLVLRRKGRIHTKHGRPDLSSALSTNSGCGGKKQLMYSH